MTTEAPPKAPKPKAETPAYANPFALKGKGKPEKLPVKDLIASRELQGRLDIDAASPVDANRAEQFAEAMKPKIDKDGKEIPGDKFPPIKVVRITGDEKHDGELWVWDGMHTHAAAKIAKVGELDCLVWEGTKTQALAAAATQANREHEKSGKPLSHRDKVHSIHMMARAILKSDLPKKDWPSNRQFAALIGCSHTLVGDEDPFGRRKEGTQTKDEKLAKKREARTVPPPVPVATPPDMIPPPPEAKKAATDPISGKPANYEVVRLATDEVVASYHCVREGQAVARYVTENIGANHTDYAAREIKVASNPQANGSPVKGPGFDWAGLESHLGYVVRGFDAFAEMNGLLKHADYSRAKQGLNAAVLYLNECRAKFGGKKK